MEITDYHAKYFAHELTRRCASDKVDKLAPVLADAQVDLNPHQVEAALFAFQNPLGKGAILADEVGLGKTIEAALLLAQKWAEGKRRLLGILPANLRRQWSQELEEKFHLPTAILETRTFNEHVRNGNLNPLLCLQDKLIHELITALADKKPSRIVCLDRGFRGNDQLKTNAAKLFTQKGIDKFKTV